MTETSGTSHPSSVLIVDDVPDNLRLLTAMLKEQGYRARPVPNGRLALRAARNDPPDLILLDVDMPGMNGLEVCRKLKADNRTWDIPVIFISALGNTTDVVKGLRAGGIDYIVKPFQAEEVLAHVQTHLSLRGLQRQLQEQARDLARTNAELDRAARLKDEFLASMSHELRTPLNAILGMSEALESEIYGPMNEKQLKSVEIIESSGNHLLALINAILDVAKIGAGTLELEIRPIPVESVCQASLAFVKQAAIKKRLRVSSVFDGAVTMLQADGRRVKQMLVNLLSNAVKFTPEGGEIGLEVIGDEEGEVVHLVVWDTGIGILPEDRERLFQPFVQLDNSLSRRYEGTGLGLSLTYQLAELHGGSVALESDGVPGRGSRFTISLPWHKEIAGEGTGRGRSEPAPQPVLPSARPATILLAEDNESNIDAILDFLLAYGYEVIGARNGVEAVKMARQKRPDVILMDIQMPEMDGLEATRRIRADTSSGVATVPIIALTALAMPGDRERCLEAGVNEYLSKPVSLKRLVELIAAEMERVKTPGTA